METFGNGSLIGGPVSTPTNTDPSKSTELYSGSKIGNPLYTEPTAPEEQSAGFADDRSRSMVDPSKYDKYIKTGIFDNEGLDKRRAEAQGKLAKIGGFLNQAVVGEILGGAIEGFGSLYEFGVGEIANKVNNEASDFDNWAIQLGNDIRSWSQEATPIYRKNPGKAWDMGDFGWWAENSVSVASTLSLMIPAAGTVRGGAWLAKVAGIADKVGDTAKYWTKVGTTAGIMRNAENYREALDVVNQTRERGLSYFGGMGEDGIREYLESADGKEFASTGRKPTAENLADWAAAKAGWTAYKVNSANFAFDVLQTAAVFKGLSGRTRTGTANSSRVAAEQAKSAATKTMTKGDVFLQKAGAVGGAFGAQATEGLEEIVNFMGGEIGTTKGRQLTGEDVQQRSIADMAVDPHATEAGFWGILGGVAFGSVMGRLNKTDNAATIDKKIGEIAGREKLVQQAVQEFAGIKQRREAGEVTAEQAKELQSKLVRRLGYQMGLDASAAGNVDLLLETLDASSFRDMLTQNVDAIELQNAGYNAPGDVFEDLKQSVLSAESAYNTYFNRIFAAPVSDATKARVSALQVETQLTIDDRKKALEAVARKAEPYHTDATNSGLKSNMQFSPTLEILALREANETLKSAIRSKNVQGAFATRLAQEIKANEERIAELTEQNKVAREAAKATGTPITEVADSINSDLILLEAERIEQQAIINMYTEQLANLSTPATLNNIEALEQARKQAEEAVKLAEDVDKIEASDESSLPALISDLEAKYGKRSKVAKRARERLTRLSEQRITAEKTAKAAQERAAQPSAQPAPKPVVNPTAPITGTPAVEEAVAPILSVADTTALRNMQEEVADLEGYIGKTAKGDVFNRSMLQQLDNLISIVKQDKGYSDTHPVVKFLNEKKAQYTKVEEVVEPVEEVVAQTSVEPVAEPTVETDVIKPLTEETASYSFADLTTGFMPVSTADGGARNVIRDTRGTDTKELNEKTVIARFIEKDGKKWLEVVKWSYDAVGREGSLKIVIDVTGRDIDLSLFNVNSLGKRSNDFVTKADGEQFKKAVFNVLKDAEITTTNIKTVVEAAQPVETPNDTVVDVEAVVEQAKAMESVTTPVEEPSTPDDFAATREQAANLDAAFGDFMKAVSGKGSTNVYSSLIPITPEVITAGAKFIKEATKLGYITFKDIAKLLYRKYRSAYETMFPALKGVYMYMRSTDPAYRTDENADAIENMTAESIAAEVDAEDNITSTVDGSGTRVWESANVFIPSMNIGMGMKVVSEGVFQLSSETEDNVVAALAEIGNRVANGDQVVVDLSIDEAMATTMNKSLDDQRNVPIAIKYNGVTIGYLNALDSIEAAIEKGKAKGWGYDFMQTMHTNHKATEVLRQRLFTSKEKELKQPIAYMSNGTIINGPAKNPFDVVDNPIFAATPFEFGPGRHRKITELNGEREKVASVKGLGYDSGFIYMLVPSFKNDSESLNTHIPTIVRYNKLNDGDAGQVTNVIGKIARRLAAMKGDIDIYQDEELQALRNELDTMIAIRKNNVSPSGRTYAPVFNIYPPIRNEDGSYKSFGRIEFLYDNNTKHGIVYVNPWRNEQGYQITLQRREWKDHKDTYETEADKRASEGDIIPLENGSKFLALNPSTKDAFRRILKDAFKTRYYFIPRAKIASGDITMKQMADSGRIYVEVGELRNSKGERISNVFANPLRNRDTVKAVEEAQEENNLVVSLDVNPFNPDIIEERAAEVDTTPTQVLPDTVVPAKEDDLGLDGIENLDDPFALLTTEVTDVPVFSEEQRLQNWERLFSKNVALDINTHDLLFAKGRWAYGLFANAMGKIAANSPIGTEYHEAFHVVMHMYLTPRQLEMVLKQAREKYGDLTDRQLEEKLAESFRTYMVLKDMNKDGKTFTGAIAKFFEKLWNYFRRIFGTFNEQQLYRAIEIGVFNYQPSADMVESAKKLTYLSDAGNDVIAVAFPNEKNLRNYVDYMSKIVLRYLGQYSNITNRELKDGISSNEIALPRKYVLKALLDHRNAMEAAGDNIAVAEVDKMITFLRDEHFKDNSLWRRVLDNVKDKLNFNVEINEDAFNGEIPDTKLTKAWDDRAAFSTTSKEGFDSELRRIIMTTDKVVEWKNGLPVIAANNPAKLKESLNFDVAYPALVAQMINAGTVEEMLARLKAMGDVDATYELLWHKINKDDNLKAKWFANFNKSFVQERHYRITPSEQGYSTTPDFSNTNYELANAWGVAIMSRISEFNRTPESATWNVDVIEKLKSTLVDINNILNTKAEGRLDRAALQLAQVLDTIGMPISPEMMKKIMYNQLIQEEVTDDGRVVKLTPKQVFRKKLLLPIEIISAALFTDTTKQMTFSNWGTVNQFASMVGYFQPEQVERSHFNVEGNMVYGVQRHNFLSRFFEKIDAAFNPFTVDKAAALQRVLEHFREYAKDDSMRFSNALFGVRGVFRNKKPADQLTIADLNIPVIKSWSLYLFGGIKDTTKREGAGYAEMSDRDWELAVMQMFLDNPTKNPNTFTAPTLVLSDSGNIYQVESQRFRVELDNKGKVTERSEVFDALMNTVHQEVVRMRQAAKLIFQSNPDGSIRTDENGDFVLREMSKAEKDALQVNYHFAKQDNDGNPILLVDGKPTGNVFKFHNMSYMQDGKLRYIQDIIGLDANGSLVFTGKEQDVVTPIRITYNGVLISERMTSDESKAIQQFVLNFANAEVEAGIRKYKKYESTMQNSTKDKNYKLLGRYGNNMRAMVADLMLNTYIAYVEHHNFFHGYISEFKGPKDDNKRAKEQSSPTQTFSTVHRGEETRIAVLDDIRLDSGNYDKIVAALTSKMKGSRPELTGMEVRMDKMRKQHSDHNALEAAVFAFSKNYLGITTTDGQGYLTMNAYKNLLKDAGRWNKKWEDIFNKIEANEDLDSADLNTFLLVMKPYYFDRYFDRTLKKLRSRQLKMSVAPLLPQFIRGTQLEQVAQWANENSVDHIYFASASKVGTGRTTPIADDKGNLREGWNSNIAIESIRSEGWGLQLDVVPHLKDTENKLGIQIARLIFSNLSTDAIYQLPGVANKLTGAQLLQKFHEVMGENIEEDSKALMKRLGAENVNGEWITKDIEKVYQILAEEIDSHDLPQNYKDMIEPYEVDGETVFRIPLFLTSVTKKYQTLLTSLFTNNVINQKFPGGHVVLATDALITGKVDVERMGIDLTSAKKQEIAERGEFQLNYHLVEDGKISEVEVLMPAHTRKLFTDGQRISIDQIPDELRTFIGYRIPTEAKYSIFRFKVVGFLPEVMDSTIIMPKEFVAQTGWDFDVDSVYFMNKQFNKAKAGEEGNETTVFEVPAYEEDQKNNRAAKNNRIFDIFSAVLSNEYHYGEMITPGSIADIAALRKKQEELTGQNSDNINPNTRGGQDYFRSTNMAGRTLKGMAANQNSLAPILQAVDWSFNTAIPVAYSKDIADTVRKRYEILYEDDKIIVANHAQLAKAKDGSYLNVTGDNITDHAAQILANILDIVKEGVPYNLNMETFDAMAAMVYSGITIDYAGQFIRQPIIKRLAEEVMDSSGLTGKASFTILSRVRRQYQTNLFKVQYYLGKHTAQQASEYRLMSKNGNWVDGRLIYVDKDSVEGVFGYDVAEENYWTQEQLDSMIGFTNPATYPGTNLNTRTKGELEKLERFMIQQLKVLNMYQTVIQPNGKALSKASRDFSADKFNIGLLSNIDSFKDSIASMNTNIYENRKEDTASNFQGYVGGFRDTGKGTPQGDGKDAAMREVADGFLGEIVNKQSSSYTSAKVIGKKDDIDVFISYEDEDGITLSGVEKPTIIMLARNSEFRGKPLMSQTKQELRLSHESGAEFVVGDMPNVDSQFIDYLQEIGAKFTIYHTGNTPRIKINEKQQDLFSNVSEASNDSKYSTLNSYYQWGIHAADTVLSPLFFSRRQDYKTVVNGVLNLLRLRNTPENVNAVSDFFNFLLVSEAPFFSRYDSGRILGVGIEPQFGELDFADYIDLSVANKVQYVKTHLKELLDSDVHFLNFLNAELNQSQIERTGIHRLVFNKPKTSDGIDNDVIRSFEEMFFSDNEYLQDLAMDLIAYDAYTSGMTFGRNSFSNYLPAAVLDSDEVQLGDYLRYIEANGIPMQDGMLSHSVARLFAKSQWANTTIVPRVQSKYQRDSEGRYISKTDDSGNTLGYYTVDNTPDWSNETSVTSPIKIAKSELRNEPIEIQNARFVLASRMVEGKYESVLLERIYTDFDAINDSSSSAFIYYAPTSRLGNTYIKYENAGNSVIQGNNVPYTYLEYVNMVASQFPVAVERSAEGRLIENEDINCK